MPQTETGKALVTLNSPHETEFWEAGVGAIEAEAAAMERERLREVNAEVCGLMKQQPGYLPEMDSFVQLYIDHVEKLLADPTP